MDKYMENQSELLIYQTPDCVTKIETSLQDETAYYNLDVIISVGYLVKSHRGTQFRI